MFKVTVSILLGLILAGMSLVSMAEEDEDQGEARYVDLTPALVANFGGPGKLKFLRADLSLRVDSQEAMRAVAYHLPALRHALIMLLSNQTGETLSSAQGKEQLRLEALELAQKVIEEEEGQKFIVDLLFTGFFVQH